MKPRAVIAFKGDKAVKHCLYSALSKPYLECSVNSRTSTTRDMNILERVPTKGHKKGLEYLI